MKTHCTTLATALVLLSTFSILNSAFAAVPLPWQVTPRNPAPVAFDRHHGETLEFRCTFTGFGELPFAQGADVRLWYQTNGMGAAWWSVPASVSSNVLSAVFPPQADPGADRLALFFGAPSNAYASAVLRLRPSPGFTPNVLPPPEQATFEETDPVFSAWLAATDLVHEEQDPTVPAWAKSETPPQAMTTNDVCNIVTNEVFTEWTVQWAEGFSAIVSNIVFYVDPNWWQIIGYDEYGNEYPTTASGGPDAVELINDNCSAWRKASNALGFARLVDLPPLTNSIPDAAARAVYDVHDLIWDATESILYWHKFVGGHDLCIAVTNIDLTHPTNAAALKAWREANR